MLETKIYTKPNMALSFKDVTDGNGIVREGQATFMGIPIKGCEQIALTETLLTA